MNAINEHTYIGIRNGVDQDLISMDHRIKIKYPCVGHCEIQKAGMAKPKPQQEFKGRQCGAIRRGIVELEFK